MRKLIQLMLFTVYVFVRFKWVRSGQGHQEGPSWLIGKRRRLPREGPGFNSRGWSAFLIAAVPPTLITLLIKESISQLI